MAATQAESQQNDVKLNEAVKCAQKRPQVGGNSASASGNQQLDLESGEKASRGAAQLLKYVNRGGDSSFEMSQYREDIGGHPAGEVKSPRELPQTPQETPAKPEPLALDASGHPAHPGHPFASSVARDYSEEYVNKPSEFTPKQLSDYPGKQPADYGGKPGEFLGKQLDYSSKQSTNEADRGHQTDMDEHYAVSKIEPRLAHIGPGPGSFPGQPRFLSGQSISQATGPTPTLNQLLQASTPVHRFHANYPGIGPESYQQPWPIQRPPVVPPVYPQTSQRPPQTGSPRLHPGPGGPSSPTAMPYPPFTQRFSSPTRPHSPYSHHQLNSYGVQTGHAPSIYPEQRSWNQGGPANPPPPPPTNQANPASQSPQRALSQSPAPPPSASPQPQPSGQPQSFHNIQQRSTTPNTQGIDSGELSGQNSNDSSNGPAGPGTPNSQGMRPTPSPTGSTGSRSMSPAVGQQNVQMPPRPSSSQSDGSGPARMSHSPMTTQGGYQQPLGPSPHMHGYKLNSSGPAVVQPGPGPAGLGGIGPMGSGMGYASTGGGAGQQGGYPGQGAYPPPRPHMQFPQGYPPPTNSQPPPNNQYQPARPNNMAQYPPYPHKMGFNNVPSGMPPSPGPPQVYGTGGGPGMVPPGTSGLSAIGNMGPPASSMGPPPPSPNHVSSQPPATSSAVPHPHPPAATPPLNHEGSPMPPPSTTPNSHPTPAPTPTSHSSAELSTETSNDSGITTTASGTSAINVTSTSSGTVTSVITTGPDGTSLDEGSQQSTLSNASAASGEDPALTPKARKEMIGTYHSHPATPQSTVPSPGAASINSIHEEYPDMSSPGWPRTPASPVFNSHVPQDPYRSKKPDSLAKLYEMDDSMERRTWLDKLVAFMEERRTPITSCPTISKNPLDLFRLYLYVKERGGFMEVTKNKTWKDIAGLLGIGASSSAAYTLRKHYTKHLLAYECHFDRGGVDPQPIINQVEASSKKKNSKSTASVPSPGSSNSQDSFPAAGSSSTSMDGYGSYQSNYTSNAPGGSSAEYTPPPRPPSQSSAPSPHQGSSNQGGQNNAVSVLNSFDDGVGQSAPKSNAMSYPGLSGTPGMQQGAYQGGGSYQNYPQDYIRPQGNTMTQQGDFNQPYSPRSHYPQYSPDAERAYAGGNMPPNNTAGQEMYNRYAGGQQPSGYSTATPPSARNNNYISGPQGHPPNAQPPSTSQPSSPSQSPATPTYSCPQDYYRQEQAAYGTPGGNQMYSGGAAANKNMPPPPPGPTQPRRHPDFAKDQQYPPYNQQRPTYPGWTSTANQYSSATASNRVPYPSQQSQQQSQQQQQPPQVATAGSPSTGVGGITGGQQWSSQQPPRPSSQPNINAITHAPPPPWDHRYPNQPSPLYPPPGSHQSQLGMNPMIGQQPTPKREMTFPSDSVEAITPLLYKRRKLTRADVAPVEAWRIMMALRSGLLAESCWALDVLNILLFDDTSVSYFGLAHLPGLLDVLLEHFSRSLSDMFDFAAVDDERYWCQTSEGPDVDLGAVTRPIDAEDRAKLLSTSNYTFLSRRGRPVKVVPRDDDLFVLDSRRPWDHLDCEADTEPWQVDSNSTKYIVTSFQSEVSTLPFARHLRDEKPPLLQKEVESVDTKDESKVDGTSTLHDNLDSAKKSDESNDKLKDCGERKQADKKKKTKTLSDVLSRIKKEPMEMNDLTRELFEKKNDVPRKECESEAKANNNMGEHFSGISKTDEDSFPNHNGISDSLGTAELEKREIKREIEESEEAEEVGARDGTDARDEARDEKEASEGPRLKIRDPAGTLKRRRINDYEDESYSRDEASLYLVTESQDSLARRCVCLSTILRNLTFIPGNEIEFAKNVTFLSLLGKLLLLHHEHPVRTQKTRNYDREEDADFADSCSSLQGESEWWWDFLHHIRENVLVMAANIAGHMDLSQHPEEISRPVLDGLLHWAVCPAAHGQDPFPTVSPNSSLSPQRLALEALCKLCVTESNVDLVVATPPYSRLQRLCSVLTRLLCRSEEQVLREFGVNLLHFLSAADSGVARTIALQTPCVALLVAFIEQAESSALGVANQHGLAALRDNPESMGTSLDMLRRAAGTLLNLARHPDNRTLLLQHESRLLALVMSQILDQQVAAIVARVLFQCSRGGVGGAGSNGVSSNNSSSSSNSSNNNNNNNNNTNNVISNVTTTILTTSITNTTTVTTTTTTTTTTS